jgi:DUF2934 family protein
MIDEKVTKRKTIRTRAKPGTKTKVEPTPTVDRRLMIEHEAYLRAERRGFEPGHELEDWLAAEHALGSAASA